MQIDNSNMQALLQCHFFRYVWKLIIIYDFHNIFIRCNRSCLLFMHTCCDNDSINLSSSCSYIQENRNCAKLFAFLEEYVLHYWRIYFIHDFNVSASLINCKCRDVYNSTRNLLFAHTSWLYSVFIFVYRLDWRTRLEDEPHR